MVPEKKIVEVDRRADMEAFKKDISNQVAEMRDVIQKIHGETVSSRESVNANSRHMITMCDLISDQYNDISVNMKENTRVTKETATIAQNAFELAKKTAEENRGLFEFYQSGKKTAEVVSRNTAKAWLSTKMVTLKASRTARILIPLAIIWSLGMAIYHGESIHIKDILEAIK